MERIRRLVRPLGQATDDRVLRGEDESSALQRQVLGPFGRAEDGQRSADPEGVARVVGLIWTALQFEITTDPSDYPSPGCLEMNEGAGLSMRALS